MCSVILYSKNEWYDFPTALSFCSGTYSNLRDMFSVAFPVWGRRTDPSNPLLCFFFKFRRVGWDWVHLVRRPLIVLLYQPRMIDDECRAVYGISIDWWNRSTRRKPAPVPLCPPQIPRDLTWARTQAAAVGSRLLTAWAMGPPYPSFSDYACSFLCNKNSFKVISGKHSYAFLIYLYFWIPSNERPLDL
jgi:hypothetical protein